MSVFPAPPSIPASPSIHLHQPTGASLAYSHFHLHHQHRLLPHRGRHTFGTVVMERTKNPYIVMEGMGDEDLDTTMGYMHNDTSQLKAVIDAWNREKADLATTPLTDSLQ
jgi:integrase